MKRLWVLPAAASVAFTMFSAEVMIKEGPFGFLAEHSRNGWSAQIGIDLVCAAVLALCFAAPVARRHGIRPLPWVLATVVLGSPAVLAFAARILYVRSRAGSPSAYDFESENPDTGHRQLAAGHQSMRESALSSRG